MLLQQRRERFWRMVSRMSVRAHGCQSSDTGFTFCQTADVQRSQIRRVRCYGRLMSGFQGAAAGGEQ
jgi:hypothetical protein